jgi:hypothetical protein
VHEPKHVSYFSIENGKDMKTFPSDCGVHEPKHVSCFSIENDKDMKMFRYIASPSQRGR